MMRKFVALGLALLLITAVAFADQMTDVVPLSGKNVSVEQVKGPVAGIRQTDATQTDIFILRRHTAPPNDPTFSGAEYYLSSGATDDTFAVYLKPVAACSLYWVQEGWYNAGTVTAYLWEPGAAWMAAYPSGRVAAGVRASVAESPIGSVIFGPANSTSAGYGFGYLFDPTQMETAAVLRENAEPFMAGWVKQSADQLPQPLADNVTGRGFAYTWFGGPWTTSDPDDGSIWGGYSSGYALDVILEVGVSYPWGSPPIIESLNQVANTINGNKQNDVSVTIQDPLSGWTAADHAWLVYEVWTAGTTSAGVDSFEITDDDANNEFLGTMPDLGLSAGDVVEYWVTALDDEDNYSTTAEAKMSYDIEPTPTAENVLWVDEGSFGGYVFNDNWYYRDFCLLYAMVGGYTTEGWVEEVVFSQIYYWDADQNNGIDSYLIDANDWDFIFYTGSGAGWLPMYAADDNPYSTYIANGGGIFLASPDYYFEHGITADAVNEFQAGDFAYDVFGISGGYSDPNNPDSVYTGTAGTLTAMFADTPFEIYPLFWRNENYGGNASMDFIYPNTSITNDLLVSPNDGNIYGVKYTTSAGGKTAFFSFDIGQASVYSDDVNWNVAPTQQLTDFIAALWTYYDTAISAPEAGQATPVAYSLNQNYPNPFNPSTQISFTVPQTGKVMVKVYNVAGQEVASLFNGNMSAGTKTLTFDASNLASGVYLYRMDAGDFSQTRKMVLVK